MSKLLKRAVLIFMFICGLQAALDQAGSNYGIISTGGTPESSGTATGIYLKNPGLIGLGAQGNTHSGGTYQEAVNFYAAAFNITFDLNPPIALSIRIKNGESYTNSRNVSLYMSAQDNDGLLDKMRISNDQQNWTTVNYATFYSNWQLSTGEGEKFVYVQFSDLMGNWSDIISDNIIFDATPPNAPAGLDFSVAGGALGSAVNTLTKSGGTADLGDSLQWRYRINNSTWTTYGTQSSATGTNADGITAYAIQARSIDSAGNYTESEIITKTSIDRQMNGCPGMAPAIPWTSQSDPATINFADCNEADADQNNYQIYWGKDINGSVANAGAGHLSEYNPPIIAEGPGTYYLRASASDLSGNYGPWTTVAVYHYYLSSGLRDYYFESAGVSENLPDNANARLVRIDLDNNNEEIGFVSINAQELGLNINEDDFSRIIIDRDADNNPFIYVPEDSALATTVNAAKNNSIPVWVPIKLGKFTEAPLIYVTTGNGFITLTGYRGLPLNKSESDRIRNYSFDPLTGYVSFEVNEFSQYGTVEINNIVFDNFVYYGDAESTVSVRVKVTDENNEGVEGAPVTFSITSGGGSLESEATVTTDAEGYASVIYKYPAIKGNTVLSAETALNIDNTCIMTVMEGLTVEEQEQYDTWAAQFSPSIGGPGNDPDGDGVANLYEWNFGETPTTDPTDIDTDDDGFDDKYDAYPAENTLKVFDAALDDTEVGGKTFIGTAKGQVIYLLADNMYVQYNELSQTDYISKNITLDVEKISGLAHERIKDGNLGEIFNSNIYKGLQPGREYSVLLSYINRGNDDDSYVAQVSLEQSENRWASTNYTNNLSNVSRWQQTYFEAKVIPAQANAYERATLNVAIELSGETAKQYERHPGAWMGGTFDNDGWYGGIQRFPVAGSHVFVLEAEGYEIKFLSKSAVINVPEAAEATQQGNLIPGSQIIFTIVLKNMSSAVATSINVTDIIPQNCHLYLDNYPDVEGAINWTWLGANDNSADETTPEAIKYEITIPNKGTITVNYTVTVD